MRYDREPDDPLAPHDMDVCPCCGWSVGVLPDGLFCRSCLTNPTSPLDSKAMEGIRIAWDALLEWRDDDAKRILKEFGWLGVDERVWPQWEKRRLLEHDLRIPLVDRSIS